MKRSEFFKLNYVTVRFIAYIPLTKTTAAQNEVTLSYHRLRGLYFPAVISVTTIVIR